MCKDDTQIPEAQLGKSTVKQILYAPVRMTKNKVADHKL